MFVLNTGYSLAPVSMGRTTTELAARWSNSQMAYVPGITFTLKAWFSYVADLPGT